MAKKLRPKRRHYFPDEGVLEFCTHCGARWDPYHQENGCPVMGATARILGATDEEAEQEQREVAKRRSLKERLRAVLSGRAGW